MVKITKKKGSQFVDIQSTIVLNEERNQVETRVEENVLEVEAYQRVYQREAEIQQAISRFVPMEELKALLETAQDAKRQLMLISDSKELKEIKEKYFEENSLKVQN